MKFGDFIDLVLLFVFLPIGIYKVFCFSQKFYQLLAKPEEAEVRESLERAWSKKSYQSVWDVFGRKTLKKEE